MSARRFGLKVVWTLLLIEIALVPAAADVQVTKNQRAGWFAQGQIDGTGDPGDEITVTFSDGSKKTTYVNSTGGWGMSMGANRPSGKATVTDQHNEKVNITIAQGFTPPNNSVQTLFAVLAGSTASVGGQNFNLGGGFTTLTTNVDYNPASPTYGQLSGSILAQLFQVSGTGGLGKLTITLAGNQPYSVNVLPLFNAQTLDGGVSIPLSMLLAGTLSINGLNSPFSGIANGTDTVFPGNTDNLDLAFDLTSNFGEVTGTFLADGTEQLIPEPSALAIIGTNMGMVGLILGAYGRRRQNKKHVQPRSSPPIR